MTVQRIFIVETSDEGTRLDFFIARNLSCGQRTVKRLILNKKITVNGKTRPAHYKITAGMEIAVSEASPQETPEGASAAVSLVAQNADYAVFFKPAGLHTAKIAGSSTVSLEALLADHTPPVILLSRLDRDTSGLVAAAFSQEAAERFKISEAKGEVRKDYIALVKPAITEPLLLRNALGTANRKTTRVFETFSEDATRFTEIRPLAVPSSLEGTNYVAATIKRGARHQIRAHLAFAGHPIIGDTLYGETNFTGSLYLHHARLAFPGFTAFAPPPWLPDFLEDFLQDHPCASLD